MTSSHRFSYLRDTVRSHPVIVATTAATGGVLLGAFVVFQAFAPTRPHENAIQAVETKPAPKPVMATTGPITTGSAVAGDNVTSADCDSQTWPNLSRVCMEQLRDKNRASRVVSTDKPPIAATDNAATAESEPVALPPPAALAPVALTSPPVVNAPTPATDPGPAPNAALALATPEPPAATAPTPAQDAAKVQPKLDRAAKKAKSKAKVKRDFNEDDDTPVASNDDEDRDARPVARRTDRSRRIVERWTERDYDVRADDGDGQRRVTVIRRARSAGPLEALFGIGRDDD